MPDPIESLQPKAQPVSGAEPVRQLLPQDLRLSIPSERHSICFLPSETPSANDFVILPLTRLFQPYVESLARTILEMGGKIALPNCLHPSLNLTPTDPVKVRQAFGLPVDSDRLVLPHFQYSTADGNTVNEWKWLSRWPRDYFGVFVQGDHGSWRIVDPLLRRTGSNPIYRSDFPSVIGRKLGIDVIPLDVVIEGGNIVPVGRDHLVVSSKVITDNPSLSSQDILSRLQVFGRPNIIVVPICDYPVGHADCVVTQVHDVLIVPKVEARAFQYSSEPKRLNRLQKRYESVVEQLSEEGFSIERLPLPVPIRSFSTAHTVSPVNLLQFRDGDGALKVIIPCTEPTYYNENDQAECWPGHEYNKEVIERAKELLCGIGVNEVRALPVPVSWMGGVHCLSKLLPADLCRG